MSFNRTNNINQQQRKDIDTVPSSSYQRDECLFDQNQEDELFRKEMEQCRQYIKEIQSQIGDIWQTPQKARTLSMQQQNAYFVSQISLKQKLALIKNQKSSFSIQRKRNISNLTNKSDRRSRSSTISTKMINKCQQRLTDLQRSNQNRLSKKNSKTLSLVKLKNKELSQGNEQQQFVKQLLTTGKQEQQQKAILKKLGKLRLFKKHTSIPDDGTIPMLIQLNYNISKAEVNLNKSIKGIHFNQSKKQLAKPDAPSKYSQQKSKEIIVKNKSQLKMAKQVIKVKCEHRKLKLKINDYVPEIKSQITVADWSVLNRIVDVPESRTGNSTEVQLNSKINQNYNQQTCKRSCQY